MMPTVAETNKEDPKPWYQATGFYTEGISDVEHLYRFEIPFGTRIGGVMLEYWSKQNPANLLKTHIMPALGEYEHDFSSRISITAGQWEDRIYKVKIKDMETVGLAMDVGLRSFLLYVRHKDFYIEADSVFVGNPTRFKRFVEKL